MRDIVLSALLFVSLPLAVARPFYGAMVFAMLGILNPHRWTWGFAYSMPWAMMFAVATIAGTLFAKERVPLSHAVWRYLPMILFMAWAAVTSAYAIQPYQAWPRWEEVVKVHVMCLITLLLLTDFKRIKILVWVITLSVAYYGVKGGIFTILTGGQYLVWGPLRTAIQDNNHLATGLIMTIPLLFWLRNRVERKYLKLAMLGAAGLCAVAALGTHSRGALLAIAAMALFLWWKTRNKAFTGVLIALLTGFTLFFMPAQFWERMETIRTYQEDASAMGRINTWQTAINIANDRITGGGYEYYGIAAFRRYAPNPNDIKSAHSIYFQALGEHGWPGLTLFLAFWASVWLQARRIIRSKVQGSDADAARDLARMAQVSIIAYLVGGAFLNIGNWDMPYYLAVALFATGRLLKLQEQKAIEPRVRRMLGDTMVQVPEGTRSHAV